MKLGSLFSGYGGLELGVQSVLGGDVAWHVEFEAAPSAVLEYRWPGVPNFGDIRSVDWSSVEPVDVLLGGFPCQDVSLAGRRRGLSSETRSGLWSEFARAIDLLRPSLVVIENVRGLLSAKAERSMEFQPGPVGNGGDGPVLRALGAVLGDLADLGYDAQWCGLRAADVGAPHGRFRVFILAHPAGDPWGLGDGADGSLADAGRGRGRGWSPQSGPAGRDDAAVGSGAGGASARRALADPDVGRRQQRDPRVGELPVADPERGRAASDPRGQRLGQLAGGASAEEAGPDQSDQPLGARRLLAAGERGSADAGSADGTNWGPYEPAIRRWEAALGRPAPAPTAAGARGGERLSARFVEWMMGLPSGWVTDPAIGLSRTAQLRLLGNGVVPQQAAHAIASLLPLVEPAPLEAVGGAR